MIHFSLLHSGVKRTEGTDILLKKTDSSRDFKEHSSGVFHIPSDPKPKSVPEHAGQMLTRTEGEGVFTLRHRVCAV